MAKLISKTYGDALLSVAVEEEKVDSFYEEALGLKKVLEANSSLYDLINNPRISLEDKQEVMDNVFKGRISQELLGFLHTVVSKGRFSEIYNILEYFGDEVKKLKGIGVAHVVTPRSLDEIQKATITEKLLATTDFKTMEMDYTIDESLIGGMQIRIGDRVVDSSVRTKISKMQQQLLNIQLS